MVELTTLLRRAFALIMFNKVAALVAVVWVFAALRAGVAMEPSTQEPAWLTHTDSQAGLEISYPADWEVIVAEERLGPGTKWTPLILGEGELFKVAFRESGDVPWPAGMRSGSLQIMTASRWTPTGQASTCPTSGIEATPTVPSQVVLQKPGFAGDTTLSSESICWSLPTERFTFYTMSTTRTIRPSKITRRSTST